MRFGDGGGGGKDKITAAACIMIYLRALRCAAEEIYSRGNARECGRFRIPSRKNATCPRRFRNDTEYRAVYVYEDPS
jgi:hypothetical protein